MEKVATIPVSLTLDTIVPTSTSIVALLTFFEECLDQLPVSTLHFPSYTTEPIHFG